MATDSVERVYRLVVDGTEAVNALKKIEQNTGEVSSKMARFGETVKAGLAAFAIKETAQQLVTFLTNTAQAMDDLGDSSQKLGVAAQDLETFRLAAQMSGASAEDVDRGLKSLSKSMAEFDSGSKSAIEAFSKIGVNPSGKSTADVLEEIAQAFAGLPDDANKTALAMELLGKAGAELIPMLNGGAQSFADFNQQLRDLGMALSEEDVKNAQALGDAVDTMKKQAEGAGRQFMTGLVPALTEIVTGFTEGSVAAEKWNYYGKITGVVLKTLIEAASQTGQAFIEMGKVGVAAFQSLVDWDKSKLDAAIASFKNFNTEGAASFAKLEEEAKRIQEDRTFEKISKAISLPEYNDEKPKRAAADIANTGKAAKSAAAAISDYDKAIKTLNAEFDSITGKLENWGRVETLLAQVRRENLKLTDDEYIALLERAEAIDQLNQKLQEQAENEAAFQAAVARGEGITSGLESQAKAWQDVLDPMAKFQRQWETIAQLGDAGMLSEEQVWAAWAKNADDAAAAAKKLADQADPTKKAWEAVAETLDQAIGQGLADILLDSEKDLSDWVDSFLKQLSRILMNQAIMGFIKMLTGGSGGTGGLFSTAMSFIPGFGTSATAVTQSAPAVVIPSPMMLAAPAAPPVNASPITSYSVGTLTPAAQSAGYGVPSVATTSQSDNPAVVTYITVNSDGTSTTTSDDIAMARKLDSAVKQTIMNEMRPGGILSGVRQ